jgi:aminoglycoside phosphotransferase (APT) family kinase protein
VSSITPTLGPSFDLAASPALHAALPGLAAALDPAVAAPMLERTLLRPGATVASCRPGKALYLGADGCSLRYDLDVRTHDGRVEPVLVAGRVLPDDDSLAGYADAVARLAPRVADGPTAGAVRSHAELDGRLVVHVFPIDPELPTLVEAVDPAVAASMVDGLGDARVTVAHYGRRGRCVLRYDRVDGGSGPATVYGKVWSDEDWGARVCDALAALGGTLGPARVPSVYGYRPRLHFALFEALAGGPALTKTTVLAADASGLIGTAAAVAAALHASHLPVTTVRSLDTELAELRGLVALVGGLSPGLRATLEEMLGRVVVAAASTDALPVVPTHGDFTPSQLLSDGASCGVVDFDDVAQGEAALDLGQYQAYVRLTVAKAGAPPSAADALCDQLLQAYTEGAAPDELMARTRVYACVSLLRTTMHALQKLKPVRAAMVFAPLTEEVGWLTRHLG